MLLGEAFQLIGEELCSRSTSAEICKVVDILALAERFTPMQFPCCRDGKLNLSVGMAERIPLAPGPLTTGHARLDRR
jgi:hypothetical protein